MTDQLNPNFAAVRAAKSDLALCVLGVVFAIAIFAFDEGRIFATILGSASLYGVFWCWKRLYDTSGECSDVSADPQSLDEFDFPENEQFSLFASRSDTYDPSNSSMGVNTCNEDRNPPFNWEDRHD